MIPWTLIDSAQVPGDGTAQVPDGNEIRLYRRDSEYSIRVGSYELMNNRVHGSEDALASIVCERLSDREHARVLIGGLGMGFTLAGVLKDVGAASEVVVAELVPAVVTWNRGPLGAFAGHPLEDRRVDVREVDVGQVIRAEESAYDAILLDVDNGPAGLTSKTNDWLYGTSGLRAAFAALRPGGILAIWSAGPDAAFTKRLQQNGFAVEQVRVRGRGKAGGSRFLIWIARRR
jgi:spermidine synthase